MRASLFFLWPLDCPLLIDSSAFYNVYIRGIKVMGALIQDMKNNTKNMDNTCMTASFH